MNYNEKLFDNINNEFCKEFSNVLNIPKYNSYVGSSIGCFEIVMKNDFNNFSESPYLFNSKKNLLHFTSIAALFSIVQEQSIRMYNMNISNDENEYTYAAEIFKPIYEKIGNYEYFSNMIKTNLYYLSLTGKNNLFNKTMWEEYGDKNKGIAIEFTLESEKERWEDFYFSKVLYDKKINFSPLFNVWDVIINKFPKHKFKIDISPLLAFNKSKKWDVENEIRLLIYDKIIYKLYEFGLIKDHIYEDFRSDKTRINKEIKFFRLPLYNNTENKPYKINNETEIKNLGVYPLLKIENIYFGNYWNENYLEANELFIRINNLINEKLGYKLSEFSNNNIINTETNEK